MEKYKFPVTDPDLERERESTARASESKYVMIFPGDFKCIRQWAGRQETWEKRRMGKN